MAPTYNCHGLIVNTPEKKGPDMSVSLKTISRILLLTELAMRYVALPTLGLWLWGDPELLTPSKVLAIGVILSGPATVGAVVLFILHKVQDMAARQRLEEMEQQIEKALSITADAAMGEHAPSRHAPKGPFVMDLGKQDVKH